MKTLYIIAGANGSGKTTFAKSFAKINDFYFINADEIAKELDSKDISKFKIKAGKIFFKGLDKNLELNNSFIIETTLSGSYLVKYIKKAKSLGFHISFNLSFLRNTKNKYLKSKK